MTRKHGLVDCELSLLCRNISIASLALGHGKFTWISLIKEVFEIT